jgi:CBS-domain-containing membrane protein
VHRIPVVDPHGDLVSVVTQSHLVKLFRDNHSKFDVMTKKIGDLKLGYKDVLTVKSVSLSEQLVNSPKTFSHKGPSTPSISFTIRFVNDTQIMS